MKIKCLVGVNGCNGPELIPVIVDCIEEQYNNGDHYDAARDIVMENYDVSSSNWIIDENDCSDLFESTNELYNWSTADETFVSKV